MAESHLVLEAQNVSDFAHGTPSCWHRASPVKRIGQLSQENASSSTNSASFRSNVTDDSGNMTGDSGQRPKIGHFQSECAVTFGRKDRSRSNGISGQLRPEYACSGVGAGEQVPDARLPVWLIGGVSPCGRSSHHCQSAARPQTVASRAMRAPTGRWSGVAAASGCDRQ